MIKRGIQWIKSGLLYVLPHHFLSRITYRLTRIRSKHAAIAIRMFACYFRVDLSQAVQTDINQFACFNDFFIRKIRPECRPIANEQEADWVSPVDGRISQLGTIKQGRIIQAKRQDYSVLELLGGHAEAARHFNQGSFATIYLSPRDYHRIHMPCSGQLTEQIYVPGRLFSVADFSVTTVPRIFSRNERVIALFDTNKGKMAVAMIGAINVSAIETVCSGLVTPNRKREISIKPVQNFQLNKADELGRFNMGSTVVLLFEQANLKWHPDFHIEAAVQFGQAMAKSHNIHP